jgi:hypothetical protein
MKRIVAERTFEEPLTDADLELMRAGSSPCYDAHRVTFVRSLVSADRKRTICEYDAPDADSVRQASQKLGVPYDRVYPADIVERHGSPEEA